MADIEYITNVLAPHGLMLRGGFHPTPDDGVPGDPATLVLVGNAGPDMWNAFTAVQAGGCYGDSANPLDDWVHEVLSDAAAQLGATPLFPSGGPPHLPFQRWAQRAEAVAPSPLGVLIHPDYGLWHAYRGALAFDERLDLPPRDTRPRPCDTCADKPCLATCPVDAFGTDGYNVPICVGHISTPEGADCMDLGCRARRACPVGPDYIYEPTNAAFHMAAFRRAQSG
ncbi:MAG: ferredoxin [Alphaproteobacteria bacterium]|nr:ferredoxin [Alphaproteobacteria bacterium]